MAHVTFPASLAAAKAPIDVLLMQSIIQNNDVDFQARILNLEGQNFTPNSPGAPGIFNPSFEIDGNNVLGGSSGIPAGWTFTAFGAGSCAIDQTTVVLGDGINAIKITNPGGGGANGGGTVESKLVPITQGLKDYWLKFRSMSNVATASNMVGVKFYDKTFSYISTTTIWTASAGQTTAFMKTWCGSFSSVPVNARYMSVLVTGGVAGTAASVSYFDGFYFFVPTFANRFQIFNAGGVYALQVGPESVKAIVVAFGAGGGGGDDSGGGVGSGGAGAGAMNAFVFDVTPDDYIGINVGAGGAGVGSGGGDGGAGGSTTISYPSGYPSTTNYSVPGGAGGGGGTSSAGAGGAGGIALPVSGPIIAAQNGANGTAHSSITGGDGAAALNSIPTWMLKFSSVAGVHSGGNASGNAAGGGGVNNGGGSGGNGSDGWVIVFW